MAPDKDDRPDGRPVPEDRDIPEGHLILTYRGERLPWPSIASFLTAGLAAGARLLYLYDRSAPDEVERGLGEAGLDVGRLRASGQLVLRSAEEHYFPEGAFEPDRQVEDARRALREARRDGFAGLRAVGEMGWAAEREIPVDVLAEHEVRVDEEMSEADLQGLCVYPADRLGDPVLDVLDAMHEGYLGTAGRRGRGDAIRAWPEGAGAESIARETTFRSLPVPLLHVRWPEGLIQACNEAAEFFTLYDRADLIGSVLDLLFASDGEAEEFGRRCREVLRRGRPGRVRFPIHRADGESVPTEHVLIPLAEDVEEAREAGEPIQALHLLRTGDGRGA